MEKMEATGKTSSRLKTHKVKETKKICDDTIKRMTECNFTNDI